MARKKIEVDQEQLKKDALDRELKDMERRLYLIPEPTYLYDIGTPVRIGNLRDVIVSNVYFDGKFYEIDFTRIDNNYGNPIRNEHQKIVVEWFKIRKIVDDKREFIQNEDLRLSYSQRDLADLFGKAYHFGIDFDPEYQREYVWSTDDKVDLIDSIFNNIDIGKFVFVRNEDSRDYLYEVLDGKQRTRALLDFYEDRFQYKGFYYSDLSNANQRHFNGYPISIAEISDINTEQKLRYFISLNTGGKIMSKEHLDKVRNMLK